MNDKVQNPGQTNRAAPDAENYGVLVGWTHANVNGRLVLTIETARSAQDNMPRDIRKHHIMMTDNQALLLGNNLLGLSQMKPPLRRRKGWLARLFGR